MNLYEAALLMILSVAKVDSMKYDHSSYLCSTFMVLIAIYLSINNLMLTLWLSKQNTHCRLNGDREGIVYSYSSAISWLARGTRCLVELLFKLNQ